MNPFIFDQGAESLPSRERGLKSKKEVLFVSHVFVAPFAGAWIEINSDFDQKKQKPVAPFAGAWIEIGSW